LDSHLTAITIRSVKAPVVLIPAQCHDEVVPIEGRTTRDYSSVVLDYDPRGSLTQTAEKVSYHLSTRAESWIKCTVGQISREGKMAPRAQIGVSGHDYLAVTSDGHAKRIVRTAPKTR